MIPVRIIIDTVLEDAELEALRKFVGQWPVAEVTIDGFPFRMHGQFVNTQESADTEY
jgi:hypothetical protein